MKIITYFNLFFIIFFWSCNKAGSKTESIIKKKDYQKFHQEAKLYCEVHGFNEEYYFLVDLSLHSGKNRFFIYDFKTKKNSHEGLVTHGSCDQFEENHTRWENVKFSNREDSHCSSKGKYKIGKRDYSSWGINVKYWLHGLEMSNSNAIKRVVVLHSWEAVAKNEIYPSYSHLSWGCPAVSDSFMELLDTKLKHVSKPVLLWIID